MPLARLGKVMTSLTKKPLQFLRLIRLASVPSVLIKLKEANKILEDCEDSSAILDDVPMHCNNDIIL